MSFVPSPQDISYALNLQAAYSSDSALYHGRCKRARMTTPILSMPQQRLWSDGSTSTSLLFSVRDPVGMGQNAAPSS